MSVFLIISIVENQLSYNYDFFRVSTSTLEPECCYQARAVPVSVNQGKPDSGSGSGGPSRLWARQNNGANISSDTISVVFWQNLILKRFWELSVYFYPEIILFCIYYLTTDGSFTQGFILNRFKISHSFMQSSSLSCSILFRHRLRVEAYPKRYRVNQCQQFLTILK